MAMQATETYAPGNLIVPCGAPYVTDVLSVAATTTGLSAGALLTSAGAIVSASTDEVYAVLAQDLDISTTAVEAPVYLTGGFNQAALSVGGSSVKVADFKASARKIGIFFREII